MTSICKVPSALGHEAEAVDHTPHERCATVADGDLRRGRRGVGVRVRVPNDRESVRILSHDRFRRRHPGSCVGRRRLMAENEGISRGLRQRGIKPR